MSIRCKLGYHKWRYSEFVNFIATYIWGAKDTEIHPRKRTCLRCGAKQKTYNCETWYSDYNE